MTKRKRKQIVWYARGGYIQRSGPFATQIEAVRAMRLVKREPGQRDEFPDDVFVWPEEVEQ